jgi:hypothetical protein
MMAAYARSAKGFALLTALLVLGGASCTTVTKKECQQGDWNQIGFDDAVHGEKISNIKRYESACRDHGYPVDQELYERGYEKGLESFCTYQRGFNHGLQDRSYRGTCPEEFDGEFRRGYERGQKQRRLDKKADREEESALREGLDSSSKDRP